MLNAANIKASKKANLETSINNEYNVNSDNDNKITD